MSQIKALISYSHRDEAHRQSLVRALATALRNEEIQLWSDHCIKAGQEIDDQILSQLKEADVILLLVSQDFISSDYCYKTELEIALERHKNERCLVVPIVVRPTDLEGVPFQGIKMLPADAKPISTWVNADEAWLSVSRGIRDAIKALPAEAAPVSASGISSTEIRHRLSQSFDELQSRYATQARRGIGFGLIALDDLMDGVWLGESAFIASRPGHGHIELAMAAVLHAALREKKRVLVLSQRMSAGQYSNRLMCALGLVSFERVNRGWLEDDDWSRVTASIRMLRDASLKIEDDPIRSSEELMSRLSAEAPSANDLVLLDGLEYVSSGLQGQERSISLGLSDFARQKNVAVLSTLGLSSILEHRSIREPKLADLAEWQTMETYAAKGLLCYRDEVYYGESSRHPGTTRVALAKSPSGTSGHVDLRMFSEFGAVLDLQEGSGAI